MERFSYFSQVFRNLAIEVYAAIYATHTSEACVGFLVKRVVLKNIREVIKYGNVSILRNDHQPPK